MRFALAACVLLVGCSSDLPSASFIDKLRVLAIQAEPPEVAPGTTTLARALIVEPIIKAPDVKAVDAFWLACKSAPGALQATPCAVDQTTLPPLCSADASGAACILGKGPEVSYTPDASSLGTDGKGEVLLTLVAADNGPAENCLLDIQKNGGTPQDPDRCVVAFKRLVVNGNAGATFNQNPGLTSLALNDAPLDGTARFATDGSTLTLKLPRADGSAELESGGNYEALSVSWFTTSGKIDGSRSQFDVPGCAAASDCPMKEPSAQSTTHWITPSADQLGKTAEASGEVHFWAVARDDRGGVSWLDGKAAPGPSPAPMQ